MARLVRHLRQCPLLQRQCHYRAAFHHLLSPSLVLPAKTTSHNLCFTIVPSSPRNVHYQSRGFKVADGPRPSDVEEGEIGSDSDSDSKKSRNQRKREARRSVRWGMELSSLTPPQIKRIIRVVSLEQEVFDALMLVKRLGPDVREGKRRQYNYIGKLLREVKPELMDNLILATKDGDWSRLQGLSDSQTVISGDEVEDFEENYDEEEEGSQVYTDMVTRWFDGLINKDIKITNEVYGVRIVDFDRQELRKIVRRVHEIEEQKAGSVDNEQGTDAATRAAKKSLTLFLRTIAKKMQSESNHNDLL